MFSFVKSNFILTIINYKQLKRYFSDLHFRQIKQQTKQSWMQAIETQKVIETIPKDTVFLIRSIIDVKNLLAQIIFAKMSGFNGVNHKLLICKYFSILMLLIPKINKIIFPKRWSKLTSSTILPTKFTFKTVWNSIFNMRLKTIDGFPWICLMKHTKICSFSKFSCFIFTILSLKKYYKIRFNNK